MIVVENVKELSSRVQGVRRHRLGFECRIFLIPLSGWAGGMSRSIRRSCGLLTCVRN